MAVFRRTLSPQGGRSEADASASGLTALVAGLFEAAVSDCVLEVDGVHHRLVDTIGGGFAVARRTRHKAGQAERLRAEPGIAAGPARASLSIRTKTVEATRVRIISKRSGTYLVSGD